MTTVKLISYQNPTEYLSKEGIKDALGLVAYCARVSNPSNQLNSETNEKLVKYLIKHQHWSPLEMVSACLEINTTRDIAHQIVRHRSFSFQEFSQRYANPKEMGDMFEYSEARLQDTKNRQNSIETDSAEVQILWEESQRQVIELANKEYKKAIKLRSWVHYIDLRSANGTQKEHMEIAKACAEVISKIFPRIDSQ